MTTSQTDAKPVFTFDTSTDLHLRWPDLDRSLRAVNLALSGRETFPLEQTDFREELVRAHTRLQAVHRIPLRVTVYSDGSLKVKVLS